MGPRQASAHRRLNITLPEETVDLLDRVAPKGRRSQLIATAITYYVGRTRRGMVRERLREGATRRAARDLAVAEEWATLEEEAWRRRRK
jgi:CopG family transcriptional regulator/antitoxin EndoAI